MKRFLLSAPTLAAAAGVATAPWPAEAGKAKKKVFTQSFGLEACTFSDTGGNPYFSLDPGTKLTLEGIEDRTPARVEITVLGDLEPIDFETEDGTPISLMARVVEEREWEDGELAEVSRNYVARCVETGDVFYFGEDVDDYEDGVVVGHDGAWRAGVDGALPGPIMPGRLLMGSRYYQENAPGVALDRAEHVAEGMTVITPAGEFHDCVKVRETSRLDASDVSIKLHCSGIGLVYDDGLELTAMAAAPSRGPRP
jgi:hypothetical protein